MAEDQFKQAEEKQELICEGAAADRWVLSLPGREGWRRYRVALVAVGLVVVGAAAVGGVLAATNGNSRWV